MKANIMTAAEAVKLVKSGDHIFVQGSSSKPETLLSALADRGHELHDIRLYNAFAVANAPSSICKDELKDRFFIDSFFVSKAVRDWVNAGYASTIPMYFGQVPSIFRDGSIRLDVAFINCSMPDKDGYISYGVSSDLTPSAVECSRIIIAQINKQVPFSYGDAVLHISDVDAAVYVDEPLVEVQANLDGDADMRIANAIAEHIDDGATLQVGVGAIPNAVLNALTGHKNLGLHTEAMTDGMVDLIKTGVINNSRKKLYPGLTMACLAIGTRKLYDFMDYNKSLLFKDVAWTNDPFIIAQNPKMTAINSCLEVDLTGQVCADSIGTRIYSGVGGQTDFVYGASRAEGGQSFMAMRAVTAKGHNKIKPILTPGAGVVTTRFQINWFVTEYGCVNLRGKNLVERARALISCAAPQFREELDRAAYERLGYSYRTWK